MKDPKIKSESKNSKIYDILLSNCPEKKLKQTTLDTIIFKNDNITKKNENANKNELQPNSNEENNNNNHLKRIRRKITIKKQRNPRKINRRKRGMKRNKAAKKFMKSYQKIINKIEKATNINNDINENTKSIKVSEFIDDDYINDYDPEIQNHNLYPKLNFFVSCQSVSESDQDLSSASLSDENSSKK